MTDKPVPVNAEGEEPIEEGRSTLSFFEHLAELRKRLFWIIAYLIIGFAVCYTFHKELFHLMALPLLKLAPDQYENVFAFHNLSEPFFTYLRLAFYAGIFAASPFILHQVWLFISPALYREEKRYAVPFIFFTTLLFLAGGWFGYEIGLKYMISFFLQEAEGLVPVLTMDNYMGLTTKIILGMGLVFETPVVILFLALMGLVDHRMLLRKFKYAILIVFIIAAVITPSGDPVTQTVFAVPMLLLYLLGVLVAWLFTRNRGGDEEDE